MRYYIIAGEASGDLHASNLMLALQQKDRQADFRVWGGDLMEKAGGRLVKHYRDLAFMGFLEVAKNIRTILGNFKLCKQDILEYQPDVLILVDYPGFNLRMAKWAKQKNIRALYYISPQIWAWKARRVHQIRQNVERMFVILPFEKKFYQQYNVEVDFVGHPLLDVISEQPEDRADENIIALLPGSRKQEIRRMLNIMLEMVPHFPDYRFIIAGAPGISPDFYQEFTKKQKVELVSNKTYSLLRKAKAALVTSGTATLETALFNVPQVVCYQGNQLSYLIARQLVKVKYISLVNLIMDKEIVRELIQHDLNHETLKMELDKILQTKQRSELLKQYQKLRTRLGGKGASKRTANLMVGLLD